MKDTTDEFSFILKPSKHGIGVFATHDIKKDTFLRLFGVEENIGAGDIVRDKKTVPEQFRIYPIDMGETLLCPSDFGFMPIGWYLNHSSDEANAKHDNLNWHASRDIKAGEEILIDYRTLGEPLSVRDEYYKD